MEHLTSRARMMRSLRGQQIRTSTKHLTRSYIQPGRAVAGPTVSLHISLPTKSGHPLIVRCLVDVLICMFFVAFSNFIGI